MTKHWNLSWLSFLLILFVTGCKKTDILNPPTVDAGVSQTIQLPVATVTLTGTAKTSNGSITGYLWSLVSGPNVPVILSPSSTSTEVDGLISGTYHFQFLVTDNAGLTGIDTVSVIVKHSSLQTLTLQPANNSTEAAPDSYYNTGTGIGSNQITVGAWTHGGAPENNRTYLKFDFSGIPTGATIATAKLSLYATHTPASGDLTNAMSGTGNACFIQRITAAWNPVNISWNNQPSTTSQNQVSLAQTTAAFQDDLDLDVTQLVKDMQANGNNGFALVLQNEAIYNIRQYYSSYASNAATHPKLVITYTY